ncbi:MAG: hypothetical protein J6Y22_12470 [Paludibacteraceae bacterium]|nr:hypothetical protein [Paludibacteraceae bacterium]
MKKEILLCGALMLSLTGQAESFMRVELADGTFVDYKGDNIKNVTFETTDKSGTIQGKKYVDLGLSVKWAAYDVGSDNASENGSRFAWGLTTPTTETQVPWSAYKYFDEENNDAPLTKYCENERFGKVDSLNVLEAVDDAASVHWGAEWRMPTKAEVAELIRECRAAVVRNNGVLANRFTSDEAGYENVALTFPYSSGLSNYWTSSLYETNSILAYYYQMVDFTSGYSTIESAIGPKDMGRGGTAFVRAVSTSENVKKDSTVVIHLNNGEAVEYLSAQVKDLFFFDSEASSAEKETGSLDGYGYVDLGLSVLWATHNVGASSPAGRGGLYAWGETEEEVGDTSVLYATAYSALQYKYSLDDKIDSVSKYCVVDTFGVVDNLVRLEASDDAASVNWSSKWRMPTVEELSELMENCSVLFTDDYEGTGVSGILLTSKVPGYTDRSIFLPGNGYIQYEQKPTDAEGKELADPYYWSSSLCEARCWLAWQMTFSLNRGWEKITFPRTIGASIRPVADK